MGRFPAPEVHLGHGPQTGGGGGQAGGAHCVSQGSGQVEVLLLLPPPLLCRFHRRLAASARALPGGRDLQQDGLQVSAVLLPCLPPFPPLPPPPQVVLSVATRCCQAAATALGEGLEEVRGCLESRGGTCGLMQVMVSTRQAIALPRRGGEPALDLQEVTGVL